MTRYVVMGVSGCGKSSIGKDLAIRLGCRFIDGDDLHPHANIEKMSKGQPLNDEDRAPWLARVGFELRAEYTIVACSALKRRYRETIRAQASARVTFLFLFGSRDTLLSRMASRPGHFMPASLLDSQLAALEPPGTGERHFDQSIEQTPETICAGFLNSLKEQPH